MKVLHRALPIVLWLAAGGLQTSQAGTSLEQQRQQFRQAERALAAGDRQTYERLKESLRDYPLYPYLEYNELRRDLASASGRRIERFLAEHHDVPLAGRLRAAWLNRLAERGRWRDYLAFYEPDGNADRRCHYVRALLATGERATALDHVESLWLHGHSRPRACDPVFDAWRSAGRQTEELVWRRVELAMGEGEIRLARYLERYLGNPEKVWLNRWLRVHRNPQQALRDHPYRERILAHAVQRLVRFDEFDALELWSKLKDRYPFSADRRYDVERALALSLAREDATQAYRFLQGVTPRLEDRRLHAALLRAALRRRDWPQMLEWLDRLPPALSGLERWRYWRGRALEQLGREAEAQDVFAEVAGERSYYGFLAADRAGLPYAMEHAETPVDAAALRRVEALPPVRRAREFLALERPVDARREWYHLQQRLDVPDLQAAAKLAQSWGWRDQAIFTLARTGYWDDLELRFPLQHAEMVREHAARNALEPAWVYAVIRQESAFNRRAHSPAGARGLMQLMPATARLVATKLLNRRPPSRAGLYDPAVNIDLGTTYLRHVLDQLGNHPVLATAAYNAGPHRVKSWLPESPVEADVWVELVPFSETRGYLRRVLYYTAIYENRLGERPNRISGRMRPIESADTYAALARGAEPTG